VRAFINAALGVRFAAFLAAFLAGAADFCAGAAFFAAAFLAGAFFAAAFFAGAYFFAPAFFADFFAAAMRSPGCSDGSCRAVRIRIRGSRTRAQTRHKLQSRVGRAIVITLFSL
jgi:hypothetical protein